MEEGEQGKGGGGRRCRHLPRASAGPMIQQKRRHSLQRRPYMDLFLRPPL
jgi:hypothetical protein